MAAGVAVACGAFTRFFVNEIAALRISIDELRDTPLVAVGA
jgi:hypothetical protein